MDIRQEKYEKQMAMQKEARHEVKQPSKYEEQCNILVDRVLKGERLSQALKATLLGTRNIPTNEAVDLEPPFEYKEGSVIGCMERMSRRLFINNENMEEMLQALVAYTGENIGIIG